MGIESFGVFYTPDRKAVFAEVKAALLARGAISTPPMFGRGTFEGIVSTERPVEMQAQLLDTLTTKLAFRFALINPPDVDAVFFEWVSWACRQWPGTLYLMSSRNLGPAIPSESWDGLREAIQAEIDFLRNRFFEMCGGDFVRLRDAEAGREMLRRLKARSALKNEKRELPDDGG